VATPGYIWGARQIGRRVRVHRFVRHENRHAVSPELPIWDEVLCGAQINIAWARYSDTRPTSRYLPECERCARKAAKLAEKKEA
jgi:hypothetical protein